MLHNAASHQRRSSRPILRFCGVLLALFVPIGSVRAASVEIELFGHRLKYQVGPDRDSTGPTLTFGKTIKLDDPFVTVEKIDKIGNALVIVGASGPGGNACNPMPFIISVRPGQNPEIYQPQEICNATTTEIDRNGITISESGTVGDSLRTWTWTPEDGLTSSTSVKASDPRTGWKTVLDRKIAHPSEILESAEIAGVLTRLVGRDYPAFREQLGGLGSARYQGDFLIGSACVKLDCEQTGAFTGLDLQTRAVYAAFKPYEGRIAVYPLLAQWPEPLRAGLREWAKAWR